MSTIRDIRLIGLEFPLGEANAYGSARGRVPKRACGIVEVETDDAIGIGETFGPPATVAGYLDLAKGFYLGRDVFDHELVWPEMNARLYHFGLQNQMVALVSGIDVAAKDAIGKQLGRPMTALLGGRARDRVPVYHSGGYFANAPDFQLADQCRLMVADGARAAKIKIGSGPEEDARRVALARGVLGPDIDIMVDANGNYSVDLVLESMRRIADHRIVWYEEPLPPQDFQGYALLHPRAPIPVATGEAHYTMWNFHQLLVPRGADVLQPDIALVGGLAEAKAIATLARVHNVRLSPHVWGSAVGLAAAVHWVASLPAWPHSDFDPAPTLVEYDIGANGLRDALLTAPLKAVGGEIAVPTGPGLGIALDPDAVKRFRVL